MLAPLAILLAPVATIGQAQAAEQAVPIEVAPDRYVPDDATWPIVSRQTNADGTQVVVRRAPADSPMVKAEIAEGCGTKAVQAGWTCKFSHLDSRTGTKRTWQENTYLEQKTKSYIAV